ncbi:MAG: hypothetical protein ED559_13525 [Phycisphaera sp.]|nr:MAG: hypothetical protein ED559_13525 [Phycisphaera sp.]
MLLRLFLCVLIISSAVSAHSQDTADQAIPEQLRDVYKLITPSAGDEILTQSASGGIKFYSKTHAFEYVGFEIVEDDEGKEIPALIGVFNNETGFIILPVDFENEQLSGSAIMILDEEAFIDDSAEVHKMGNATEEIRFGVSGTLISEAGESVPFALAIAGGAGTSTFRIEGNTVYLNGDLGSGTYHQIVYLTKHHPEVDRIVFEDVPGSVNDEINVMTGRLIRNANYTTELLADSQISSGGVDLFLAGSTRIIAEGARIGVHSWGDPAEDIEPAKLPRSHPAHKHQVDYFSEIMDNGVEFYFYTLEAAAFDDIHWMSQEEISAWKLATP